MESSDDHQRSSFRVGILARLDLENKNFKCILSFDPQQINILPSAPCDVPPRAINKNSFRLASAKFCGAVLRWLEAQRRGFAAGLITTTVREQHTRPHHKGANMQTD